ncbi:polysaccharide lyase family 8 super-sandwich domain-containing protein [Flavivirga spongiicola]|uniref:Polysaccharide lyase beta-sandwich domain-containing protein n=1 Tax=Flavivirga spongiicola TaxID=421621 RepID=A0ABU7XX23_9FLAO|nr:polysaccharide lyase family 8 super-sandwich domain-containing protein [Flavivirga sp. MEBiC05379]MDO5980043.1 polysaccharide lyase family 8 super-sandwich domain-containing protein [Flavivirga sp. MEBiC05379]
MEAIKKIILLVICLVSLNLIQAQEVLFANYFDIETNQSEGTTVTGKINLKSNKDVDISPIPGTYQFSIDTGDTDIFEIETHFDNKGRVFGVLKVATGKNSGSAQDYNLTIVLKDGTTTKATKSIIVHVVSKTLWTELVEHYTPITISESRLYGRTKFSESELTTYITELENNNGQFTVFSFYGAHPSSFSGKDLEKEWQDASELIGGLGYAYAKSTVYGIPSGNSTNMERLKRVIYKALLQYMSNVPVYGDDVLVGGNPIGTELGDGFSRMNEYGYVSHSFLTHQWRAIDALGAPLLHVWPELLQDIENSDTEAQNVFDGVMRFHQLFFSIVHDLRDMNNDFGRWRTISDLNYSEGAFSDANIGHRMRTLMTMPILWADYNRPITYVPYWYDDYYDGTAFDGKTFGHDWSPNGVLADVRHWCNRLSTPTHDYNQSGFHPDGTVTHHLGHDASDVAMFAYGFEWLTTNNEAFKYFKNTPFPIADKNYQFVSDRLDYSYRRMLYKNSLDFLVTGRSFFSDLSNFGTKHVKKAISNMIAEKGSSTVITNESELLSLETNLNNGSHTHTETTSFWNADYLVHRNETGANNYYFSVKHKSIRTSGAEDFSKIRKSWHAGSGPFLLRVDGDEYDVNVLKNFDWHVVPGVTEAWRTDAMPTGAASDAKPGGNDFSGVLADGSYGMSGYHHKPIDTYTTAEALKSYHLIGNSGTALGSVIKRKSTSSGTNEIVTTIDQSEQLGTITYNINGTTKTITDGTSVNLVEPLTGSTWIHHNNKGYLIIPKTGQNLLIKTGSHINITATDLGLSQSINYILALDHGVNPALEAKDGYEYVMVANADLADMPNILSSYMVNTKSYISEGNYHAITNTSENVKQVSFYQATRANLDGGEFIEVDKPALVMIKELTDDIRLTIVDPLHDLNTSEITVKISEILEEDTYSYNLAGIAPVAGESVVVTSNGTTESTIVISLPDTGDGLLYNYQEQMYAGSPIVLTLKKNDSLSVNSPDEVTNSKVKIYPIPIKDYSVVETNDGSFIQKIDTYDVLGKQLFSKTYDGQSSKVKLVHNNQLLHQNQMLIHCIETTKATVFIKTF